MYKTIIFDFFGVVCSEIAPYWFDRYFSKDETKKLKDKYFEPFDLGQKSEKDLFIDLAKISQKSSDEIAQEFDELAVVDKKIIALIKTLKSNYKIGMLSNGGSTFVRSILKLYDLKKLFDDILISGEVGIVKPNFKIFDLALKKLDSQANNTIFIDDNKINILAAQKFGLKTILFKNYEQFNKDLNLILK